jgi:hypothetical protein
LHRDLWTAVPSDELVEGQRLVETLAAGKRPEQTGDYRADDRLEVCCCRPVQDRLRKDLRILQEMTYQKNRILRELGDPGEHALVQGAEKVVQAVPARKMSQLIIGNSGKIRMESDKTRLRDDVPAQLLD